MQRFGRYLNNHRCYFVDVVILCDGSRGRDEIPRVLQNNENPAIFAKMAE